MNKKTPGIALALLLALAGCGKHAAAKLLEPAPEAPARQPAAQPKESDPFHEQCRWTRRLFC